MDLRVHGAVEAGPVEIYSVANTVDGFGYINDIWAFHGWDPSSLLAVPARLYVNARGIQRIGEGCVGSFGNQPVLGGAEDPVLGNKSFFLEVINAAALAPIVFAVGLQYPTPIDLSILGITGCRLHVYSLDSFVTVTSPGLPRFGLGRARMPLPIPNDPVLKGGVLAFQAAIVDRHNGRPRPVTMTNAVSVTLR